MSLEHPNPLQKLLLVAIHFTIQIFHKLQSSCSKLIQLTVSWMAGSSEVGKTLKNIPGPISLPFFGTTWSPETTFKNLTRNTQGLLTKYGTLIKCEFFWNIPIVLVYDEDDMDKVMKVASTIRPPIEIVNMYRTARKDRYHTTGIVNTQGDEWHRLRTVLVSSIQLPKYILKCIEGCDVIANDFVKMLNGFENGKIDGFDNLIVRFCAEGSCSNVLGKRMGFLQLNVPNKMDVFITSQELYFKALHTSFYGFPWWKYVPHRIWDELVQLEDSTYDIFKFVVAEERETGPKGLLKLILASNDIHELDKLVFAMDMVMGAIEPVLNSLIFTFHFITSTPGVQDKLYEELKNVLREKDSPIDEDTLTRMPYLRSCIWEAFRLSPTTPNMARLVETEIELQGYTIPPFTLLVCQHWHACLQDKNFYRAKEFIPERWMSDSEVRTEEFLPHRGKLYHFGYGKRDCPGRRYALMEMTTLLAKVFRNFKVEFDAPVATRFEFLQSPELPINARLTPRHD